MSAQERMIRMYDRALVSSDYRQYFEDSGFYNFGYWPTGAKSQREACEALIDALVSKIAIKGGKILDVACGPGASTRHLTLSYAPRNITAINISEAQLAAARERAPGCAFIRMDATKLDFPDESFDAIMCVEAAFHFNTRSSFFKEALRVLKPGGSIVLTDMLFRGFMKPIGDFGQVPQANFVPDLPAYRTELERAGFESIAVEDATETCLTGFSRHLSGWPFSEHRRGRMGLPKAVAASIASHAVALYFRTVCKTYLIASARKPANSSAAA